MRARHIYQLEGLRGWWKGIGPNLVGVIPARYQFLLH
jgi:hypothetical protein